MNKQTKKKLIVFISIVCTILAGVLIYLMKINNAIDTRPVYETNINENLAVSKSVELAKSHYEQFYENAQLNNDYKGILFFEDDWLNLDIVQPYNDVYNANGAIYTFYSYEGNRVDASNVYSDGCDGRECTGNDVYIKMDYKTMRYDNWGSNYFDSRNQYDLNDDNLILYTHHASRDYFGDEKAEEIQGTKLDYLLDGENYKDHSTFYLLLEDEVRTYQIASVFKLDIQNNMDMQILYRTNLNADISGDLDNGKTKVLKHIQSRQLYNTNVSLDENSKYLTISTCIQGQSDRYREIILGKLIETKPIHEIKQDFLKQLEEKLEAERLEQEQLEEDAEITPVIEPVESESVEQPQEEGLE